MQRNSLSYVRTESCMAAHRVGNTTVWAEKQACTFSALSKHIFDSSNHNKTCFELKNIKKLPLHRASKWKVTLKSHTAGWGLGLWCMDVLQLEASPPQPSLICHINKRKPDSNCLIWRLYVEESRDNRLGSWRWQPAVLMWCGTSVSLSSIFDVPTAIRATDTFLGG